MGQTVAAIVYGVPLKYRNKLRLPDGDWKSEPPYPLETGTGDSAFEFIGLTIAVQNVPEADEIELPEGRLREIGSLIDASLLRTVMKHWEEIHLWASGHKVTLAKPSLMLVSIERA